MDIENLKHSYVCVHHFKPEDIISVDKITQADGKFTEKLRERPKLRTTAVPVLLPGCPAYLSAEQVGRPTRFTRESKEQEQFARALELSLHQHERDNDAFMVNSFQDLIEKIPVLLLPNMWMVCHYDCDALHIYKPEFSDQGMKILACLKVARNLRIFSFRDNLSIQLKLDVLSDIRQIEEIIQETEDYCIQAILCSSIKIFDFLLKGVFLYVYHLTIINYNMIRLTAIVFTHRIVGVPSYVLLG